MQEQNLQLLCVAATELRRFDLGPAMKLILLFVFERPNKDLYDDDDDDLTEN